MPAPNDNSLLRIGVFIDGSYFSKVSSYYYYTHERRARMSLSGLYEFIRDEVANQEGVDKRFCRVVDAHYFRGRLDAETANERNTLKSDRLWEDALIREGVTLHFMPLSKNSVRSELKEKGIDVWFALEAFELAMYKRFNVSVLITGDGDFVPLVRKLNTLGTRVMLLAWDFEYVDNTGTPRTTRTSQQLINEVTYPVMMADEIDSRSRRNDPLITNLFFKPREVTATREQVGSGVQPTNPPTYDEETTYQGSIASMQPDRGFGFVRPDGGNENLFFLYKSLINCSISDLRPDDEVSFRVVNTPKGLNAVDIEVLEEEQD